MVPNSQIPPSLLPSHRCYFLCRDRSRAQSAGSRCCAKPASFTGLMEQENSCLCCCWGRGEGAGDRCSMGACSMGASLGGAPGCVRGGNEGTRNFCVSRGAQQESERWAGPLFKSGELWPGDCCAGQGRRQGGLLADKGLVVVEAGPEGNRLPGRRTGSESCSRASPASSRRCVMLPVRGSSSQLPGIMHSLFSKTFELSSCVWELQVGSGRKGPPAE